MTQEEVLTLLKESTKNIYLGGQPGTGKTYVIREYVNNALDNGVRVVVSASTGIAASAIQGITLHSYLGVRNDDKISNDDFDEIIANRFTVARVRSTDVLIIDEISMVSAQLLENADRIMRMVMGVDKPFGGIRIIAVGDFYQLPPVNGTFAFESPVWEFRACILTQVYRQSEPVFLDVLAGIRLGSLTDDQWDVIKGRITPDVSGLDCIRIETHNSAVDAINDRKLKLIEGTPEVYEMTSNGNEKLIAGLKKNCLSPEILLLKKGAKVMFTQNDRARQQYINGTQGTVVELDADHIVVDTFDGTTITLTNKAAWEFATGYGKNKVILASVQQFPLRLAYAITIHKSQGCTFERAVIDCTRVFECGQAYVAVSRIKTLGGLFLQGKLTKNFLAVHPKVVAFYQTK